MCPRCDTLHLIINPHNNIMALTQDVTDTLSEASGLIRTALFKMAKNERPSTLTSLVKVLTDLERIAEFDVILDDIDAIIDNDKKKYD